MSSMTEKQCFNSNCRELSDKCRRGWRRRTGDYAYLCDRCASAYEEAKFCETFHASDPGWRCCESCGKKIHCGCIVSFHMFVLLDVGGIECLTCARKSYILTPNPAWPPPSHFLPSQYEIMKDFSVKNTSHVTGSSSMPWCHTSSLPYDSGFKTNVPAKQPASIDASADFGRFQAREGLYTSLPEMKERGSYERLANGKQRISSLENSGFDLKEQHNSFESISNSILSRNYSFPSNLCLTTISSKAEKDDLQFSAVISQKEVMPSPLGKHDNQLSVEASGDVQMHCVKYLGYGRNQNSLHYHPQINEEELRKISKNEKAVITPLFEKMLSASDAGRVGRLVLPKKCAEAYFPPIALPEGFPLNVLDTNGKEWVFQFRFWPNNNSRMYVLEGITPCIQSLQLQAGDIVIFSRLEPNGRLVMGGRKTPAAQPVEKGVECTIATNNALGLGDSCARNNIGVPVSFNCHVREKIFEDGSASHAKRKSNNVNTKNKRPRLECKNMLMLTFSMKEAQGLIRPSAENIPSVFIIEGYEFEEFEGDAPVIGWPTVPGVDRSGEEIQWVQCEECFKWRKVPADALLPSRWICSDNKWDAARSLCSAAEESKEQLEHTLPTSEKDNPKKEEISKGYPDTCVALEGLDKPAKLAIQDGGEFIPASSDSTTKHLHHKLGCDCVVCSSSKRLSRSILETKEKKQCEKRSKPSPLSLICHQSPEEMRSVGDGNEKDTSRWRYPDELLDGKRCSASGLKGQIDLNIKPDREDDLQHGTYSGPSKHSFAGSGQDRSMNKCDIVVNQMHQDVKCSSNIIQYVARGPECG